MKLKTSRYKGIEYTINVYQTGEFYGYSINSIFVKGKKTLTETEEELFKEIDSFIENSYSNFEELTEALNRAIILDGRDGASIEQKDVELLIKKCSFIQIKLNT